MASLESLEALRMRAEQSIDALMAGAEVLEPVEAIEVLLDYMPELVHQFGDLAVEEATQWYVESFEGKESFTANYAPESVRLERERQLRKQLREYVAQQEEAEKLRRLGEFVKQKAGHVVSASARNTTLRNIRRDPRKPRWARVPQGETTCAFCVMLASRGFAYWTKGTAGTDFASLGSRFHKDCDCKVVPEWAAGEVPDYDPRKFLELYVRGRKVAEHMGEGSVTPNLILSAMKLVDPKAYSDSEHKDWSVSGDGTLHQHVWEAYRTAAIKKFMSTDFRAGEVALLPPVRPAALPWKGTNHYRLTSKAWNHILYGDIKNPGGDGDPIFGGAHLNGYGWMRQEDASYTPFPPSWTISDISEAIKAAKENEILPNFFEVHADRGTVSVVVRETGEIRTAYYLEVQHDDL